MLCMVLTDICTAVGNYTVHMARAIETTRKVMADLPCKAETTLLSRLGMLLDSMAQRVELLKDALHREAECGDWVSKADCIRDVVLPEMNALRAVCDEAETLTDAKAWPFPTYGELLFGVK